jgi:putative chitinase
MTTGFQIRAIVPNLTTEKAIIISDLINAGCNRYGITQPTVLHEFIANCAHESGGFRIRKESLNYTRTERLVAVWPSRFSLTPVAGKRLASDYINNPTKLANFVYGGRMGNTQPGDGAAFVGGGFSQITGRDAYTMYHRFTGRTGTIQDTAKWVQKTDAGAMDSAFWFFCEYKNLEGLALQDNFRELVRRWNGGFVGWEDRVKYYERAKEWIK